MRFSKRLLALFLAIVITPLVFPIGNTSILATGPRIAIYNTSLSNNLRLAVCTPDTTKACIDSITIDGVEATFVTSGPTHYVAGGLYKRPCMFVDTAATMCQLPYMVIQPLSTDVPMTEVTVRFRRPMDGVPTSRFGATIVNGSLVSFTPAEQGTSDIATVVARTTELQVASIQPESSGYCVGLSLSIDTCVIGDTATSMETNRLNILLMPGFRSSVVPPDTTDPSCSLTVNDPVWCILTIYDRDSVGGWIDTNAMAYGLASTDRFTGAAQNKIAGPHFKMLEGRNELNLAYFRMFMPSGFLQNSFGLTPTQANATTLPVRRTVGAEVTMPTTTYTPLESGLLVDSQGIGFSTPVITVSRVLTVKRNKSVTASTINKAAGVAVTSKFGAPKVQLNTKTGMRRLGKKFRFTKKGQISVTVRYKSSKTTTSTRVLMVRVG